MTNEQKVGLFFLVGMVIAFIGIELTVGSGLFHHGYHLWVEYPDVEGLTVGDAVRIAGVKRGKVDTIQIEPDRVRVRMRLEEGDDVRRDSVARLEFQALSGSRFVAISLGSSQQPVLKDGDTVQGELSPGFNDMVRQVDGVAGSIRDLAESLNRNQDALLRHVDELITENRDSVASVMANLTSVSEKLDHGDGTLARLLNDPSLYQHAEETVGRINEISADLKGVSARLAQGEGSLGKLVKDDALYDRMQETLASLSTTARNLESISADVRDGHGTLGRLVSDESLYIEAQDAVRGLDRATSSIEDQAPISVLGTLVSTLF